MKEAARPDAQSMDWDRVQTVFHEALERPVEERWRFVEEVCSADPAALREVLAMLEADAAGSSFLDAGAADIAQRILSDAFRTRDFGPYKLIRLLGEGGMGVVWLARRTDTDSQVAIKFLPHAGLSPTRRARFAREIKLLAKLRHPCIARLYDAGTLDDGTPWFVMEYVEGSRLNDYCEEHALSLKARLQLFHQVCEAVQYAHGQTIVHRDLKPSNIQVEKDGTPRLLDFGIARELQGLEEASERTDPEKTRSGLRFYSPDYAAPEWMSEGAVGLYTDVYSLGVVLYQLLTGVLPFERQQDHSEPTTRVMRGKPSILGHLRFSLSKTLWTDLDVLCMKAMHSDWKQRYPSVEALLRDLDHYDRNEPLEARPDRASYRTAKFAARHRGALLATMSMVLLIAGLVLFFTLRLEKARDAALAEAARSHQVQQFMLGLFGGNEKSAAPSSELRAVTLLDIGAEQVDSLKSDPDTQAQLYEVLGRMYDMLGEYSKSGDLLGRALEKQKIAHGTGSDGFLDLLTMRGIVLADQAKFDEAEQSLQEAFASAKRRLSADDSEMIYIEAALGRVAGARGAYQKAIDLLQPVVAHSAHTKDEKETLGQSLASLALAQYSLGQYGAAAATEERALAFDREFFGESHPRVAEILLNMANNEVALYHYAQAEADNRQALLILKNWYGGEHPDTAAAMTHLALVLGLENKDDEAYSLAEKALVTEEHFYGGEDILVAQTMLVLGRIEVKRLEYPKARAHFIRAQQIFETLFGPSNYWVAITEVELGDIYVREGDPTRGETLIRQADGVLQQRFASGDSHLTRAQAIWGNALFVLGRYPEAKTQLILAMQTMAKQPEVFRSEFRTIHKELAIIDAAHRPCSRDSKSVLGAP